MNAKILRISFKQFYNFTLIILLLLRLTQLQSQNQFAVDVREEEEEDEEEEFAVDSPRLYSTSASNPCVPYVCSQT